MLPSDLGWRLGAVRFSAKPEAPWAEIKQVRLTLRTHCPSESVCGDFLIMEMFYHSLYHYGRWHKESVPVVKPCRGNIQVK